MIIALLVLVPVLLMSLWAFFRLSPKRGERRKVIGFNLGVLILGLAMCGLVTLNAYIDMSPGSDRAWWPVTSVLYSLVLFPAVLFVGGVVRNFFLFRVREPKR